VPAVDKSLGGRFVPRIELRSSAAGQSYPQPPTAIKR
jgi:hypothetical protein